MSFLSDARDGDNRACLLRVTDEAVQRLFGNPAAFVGKPLKGAGFAALRRESRSPVSGRCDAVVDQVVPSREVRETIGSFLVSFFHQLAKGRAIGSRHVSTGCMKVGSVDRCVHFSDDSHGWQGVSSELSRLLVGSFTMEMLTAFSIRGSLAVS